MAGKWKKWPTDAVEAKLTWNEQGMRGRERGRGDDIRVGISNNVPCRSTFGERGHL